MDIQFLIIDTETAGLPKGGEQLKINKWPRLIKLSWITADKDYTQLSSKSFFIKPEIFSISNDTTCYNGITNKMLSDNGLPIRDVLNYFIEDSLQSQYIVGHNLNFISNVIDCEFERIKSNYQLNLGLHFCTMAGSKNFLDLDKLPTLNELYNLLFITRINSIINRPYSDTEMTLKCFKEVLHISKN